MQSLNPEHALDELERAYRSYMNSPAERRAELSAALQRSIRQTEIELNNLRDVQTWPRRPLPLCGLKPTVSGPQCTTPGAMIDTSPQPLYTCAERPMRALWR
jgi:hypothetical protein